MPEPMLEERHNLILIKSFNTMPLRRVANIQKQKHSTNNNINNRIATAIFISVEYMNYYVYTLSSAGITEQWSDPMAKRSQYT